MAKTIDSFTIDNIRYKLCKEDNVFLIIKMTTTHENFLQTTKEEIIHCLHDVTESQALQYFQNILDKGV